MATLDPATLPEPQETWIAWRLVRCPDLKVFKLPDDDRVGVEYQEGWMTIYAWLMPDGQVEARVP